MLIDAGRVPTLDRGKVRLSRLIARAPDPAVALEEIGGRGQSIGLGVEVDDAVAVAIESTWKLANLMANESAEAFL